MMRYWNLLTGEVNQTQILKKNKLHKDVKLDYVCISNDITQRVMAISDDIGNLTVNNLFSGTILFNLTQEEGPKYEITAMKFIELKTSNMYVCATTCKGNVIFFTKPISQTEFNPRGKGGSADQYVSQALIKKNIH